MLKRTNINFKKEVLDKIDKMAYDMGISRTALINIILSNYLQEKNK